MNAPVVLYVDDAEDEVYLLRLALLGRGIHCDLRHLPDGEEAISYLRGSSQYADRQTFPIPAVTILDCKMPGKSGLEVLAWARQQPRLKDHPIIMFTGFAGAIDQERARELLATRYLEKSANCTELVEFLATILPCHPAARAA